MTTTIRRRRYNAVPLPADIAASSTPFYAATNRLVAVLGGYTHRCWIDDGHIVFSLCTDEDAARYAAALADWNVVDASTYTAEQAVVYGHTVTVCLDDEGPLRPAFYWDVDDRSVDGWQSTVEEARMAAVMCARNMSQGGN